MGLQELERLLAPFGIQCDHGRHLVRHQHALVPESHDEMTHVGMHHGHLLIPEIVRVL